VLFAALLSVTAALRAESPALIAHPEAFGRGSCLVCEGLMFVALKSIDVGADILGAVHHLCSLMPSAEKAKCIQFALVLEKYGDDLPFLIKREGYSAQTVCTMFGFCKEPCCTETKPEQVHIALSGDGTSSMNVMYVTKNEEETMVRWGQTMNQTEAAKGSSTTYTSGGWSGRIHTAVMTNLLPNTRYYYQVGHTALSEVYTFRTTPVRDVYRFGLIGDMGIDPDAEPTINALTDIVKKDKIDVLIHNGDISYADGYQHRWDAYFRRVQPVLGNIPYMVCPGNHEINFVNIIGLNGYHYRFSMPGVESRSNTSTYYSWNYGPVHFIALNSESVQDLPAVDAQQVQWLKNDLQNANANRAVRPWVVAYIHRPLYCGNEDVTCLGQAEKLRNILEDVFYNGKVDLVVQAHKHDYERTSPVYKGVVRPNGTAPIYIVNGVGGNREGTVGFPAIVRSPWSVKRITEWGYALLDASASQLSWRFFTSADNQVKDTLVIQK